MLDLVYFVALGLLQLLINVILDTCFFMAHLFSKKVESIKVGFKPESLTLDNFIMLDRVIT